MGILKDTKVPRSVRMFLKGKSSIGKGLGKVGTTAGTLKNKTMLGISKVAWKHPQPGLMNVASKAGKYAKVGLAGGAIAGGVIAAGAIANFLKNKKRKRVSGKSIVR